MRQLPNHHACRRKSQNFTWPFCLQKKRPHFKLLEPNYTERNNSLFSFIYIFCTKAIPSVNRTVQSILCCDFSCNRDMPFCNLALSFNMPTDEPLTSCSSKQYKTALSIYVFISLVDNHVISALAIGQKHIFLFYFRFFVDVHFCGTKANSS